MRAEKSFMSIVSNLLMFKIKNLTLRLMFKIPFISKNAFFLTQIRIQSNLREIHLNYHF